MSVFRYSLQPTSSWTTALRSDTLHGLIACQVREWEGEKACLQLIERFKNNDAPYTCSSAFPKGFLPHPVLPPIRRAQWKEKYSNDKKQLIRKLQEYKLYRKAPYISCAIWQELKDALSLENLFTVSLAHSSKQRVLLTKEEHISIGTEAHNSVSRATDTVLEGALFFNQVNYDPSPLDIYVQTQTQADCKLFENYLRALGEVGFGADSSTGKGRFEIASKEDVTSMFQMQGTHFMNLSLLSSEDCSGLDGYYKLCTKRGYAWVGKSKISPFKKPFLAFEEGSILKQLPTATVLSHIHPDEQVVQLCHGLALPCTLLDTEEGAYE